MFMAAKTSPNPKSKINPEFSGQKFTRLIVQLRKFPFPLSPSENDKLVWFLCPRNSDIWCQNLFHFQLIVDAPMTPKNNLIIFYFDDLENKEPRPRKIPHEEENNPFNELVQSDFCGADHAVLWFQYIPSPGAWIPGQDNQTPWNGFRMTLN